MTYKQPNSLIKELSPYLLQHAYNPVNWYSWNDEAFEKARIENKPIFLSIGYSTCHWCHVMEKESFEDQEIAALMNDTFISIKVDREERPDIDNIYMSVCQIMTGSGGWPLSIIMTPDQKPFFAGTYFPKESKYNRVGFKDLILSIKSAWYNKQKEIYESAEEITKHLINYHHKENQKIALDKSVLDAAYERFKNRYDTINGGFGSAPKFPSPHNLMFLLRYWHSTGELKALNMVIKTLTSMRKGGIYDHIGFGFHRYSTDSNWLVPHFEKMLYDQAMLTIAYTEAYQATHNELFKQTVDEILLYLLRDMRSEKGGFFSAEDADTDGEEGQTYVWTYQEITDILEESDANFITKVFNIKPEGNYHEESKKELTGKNILHLQKTFNELAEEYDQPERVFTDKFNSICDFLFYKRKQRKQPFKDDKILIIVEDIMKRINYAFVLLLISSVLLFAQDGKAKNRTKFDPERNPFEDLEKAIEAARNENKRILLDVGGEWCIWCHRLDAFIENNEELNKYLQDNFIVVKVNYSEENRNEEFLKQYPKIPGFPHIFILDKNGKFLHSQDTGKLEKDKSYDLDKIMNFLKNWTVKKK